jgi:hypothetical protein
VCLQSSISSDYGDIFNFSFTALNSVALISCCRGT